VKAVALIATEKDVAEAFFDQITTAASNTLERTGEEATHAMTQADSVLKLLGQNLGSS
jgi:hypothetical protein